MFLYENFVNLALKIVPSSFCSFPVGPKRFKEEIFAKKPQTEKDQEFQTTKKELTVRFPE